MNVFINRTIFPRMSPEITTAIEAKFWSKVDKSPGQGPNGDCWCWTGLIMKPGRYPRGLSINGKSHRPSHIAMAIDGRPRPSGEMEGLHSCDHPPCVRHNHLRWGTQEENRQEHLERRKPGKKLFAPEVVREIRASPERNFEIALRLGVTQACICSIRKGTTYKNLL